MRTGETNGVANITNANPNLTPSLLFLYTRAVSCPCCCEWFATTGNGMSKAEEFLTVIESNDRKTSDVQARRRRRKSAGWKSGLMLTGLGAVVLGAGYLAGVNAPAVNQATASETVARTNGAATDQGTSALGTDNQFQAPNNAGGQGFFSNGDDGQFSGNNNGIIQQFGDDDFGSSDQFSQQFNQQFNRRNRQLPGLSQQQPGFSRPLGRSRGS